MSVEKRYVLKLLRDAYEAMKEVPALKRTAMEAKSLLEKIETGELQPEIYELEPGHVVKWLEGEHYPLTEIEEDKVVHRGELGAVSSRGIHERNEFHVLGRETGALLYGFTAIGYDENGRPRVVSEHYGERGLKPVDKGSMRPYETDWKYLWLLPVYAIVAPHPEKRKRLVWIHFGGKIKPYIEKKY